MNTAEKAKYLVKLFGQSWLQGKLGISGSTLRNRLRGDYVWNQHEAAMIDELFESPVKKLI